MLIAYGWQTVAQIWALALILMAVLFWLFAGEDPVTRSRRIAGEQALIALKPGELCTAPVATRYGFHIIRLNRKHDGRLLPYELVATRIADYLRESVRRRADAQYIARLVSAAKIEGVEFAGADALRVH